MHSDSLPITFVEPVQKVAIGLLKRTSARCPPATGYFQHSPRNAIEWGIQLEL
jgi:hypothetical protein